MVTRVRSRQLRDLLFAWHVAMFVKSNAIVYARGGPDRVGAGQMRHQRADRRAESREADLDVAGSVMASDAFFVPRRHDTAAAAGIRAVIQPGGSMRDNEVIAAADEHDIAMVFTGAALPALRGSEARGEGAKPRLVPSATLQAFRLSDHDFRARLALAPCPSPSPSPAMKILVIGSGGRTRPGLEARSRRMLAR